MGLEGPASGAGPRFRTESAGCRCRLVRGLLPRAMGPPRAFRPGRSLKTAGPAAPFPPRLLPAAPLQPPPGLPVPCDPALSQGGPAVPHDLACTHRTSHEPPQALPRPCSGAAPPGPSPGRLPVIGKPQVQVCPQTRTTGIPRRAQRSGGLHPSQTPRHRRRVLPSLVPWLVTGPGRDTEELGARVYGTRAFICISSWAPQPSSLGLPGVTASPSPLPRLQLRPFNPLTYS